MPFGAHVHIPQLVNVIEGARVREAAHVIVREKRLRSGCGVEEVQARLSGSYARDAGEDFVEQRCASAGLRDPEGVEMTALEWGALTDVHLEVASHSRPFAAAGH